MSRSSSPKQERESFMSDDEKLSSTSIQDPEIPSTLEKAEKPAETSAQYESEWTVRSCLQVLGGFMLLFNTYSSYVYGG
jgi:hypothetical protein